MRQWLILITIIIGLPLGYIIHCFRNNILKQEIQYSKSRVIARLYDDFIGGIITIILGISILIAWLIL